MIAKQHAKELAATLRSWCESRGVDPLNLLEALREVRTSERFALALIRIHQELRGDGVAVANLRDYK